MNFLHSEWPGSVGVESGPKLRKKDRLSRDILKRIYKFALRLGVPLALLLSLNGPNKDTADSTVAIPNPSPTEGGLCSPSLGFDMTGANAKSTNGENLSCDGNVWQRSDVKRSPGVGEYDPIANAIKLTEWPGGQFRFTHWNGAPVYNTKEKRWERLGCGGDDQGNLGCEVIYEVSAPTP